MDETIYIYITYITFILFFPTFLLTFGLQVLRWLIKLNSIQWIHSSIIFFVFIILEDFTDSCAIRVEADLQLFY